MSGRDAADAESRASSAAAAAMKFDAAVRRRVAPVHEAVDENALDVLLARHVQQREKMLDVRVHAAVAQQTHQMQLARAAALHRVEQQRLLEKFAGRDHQVDARDVHVHDAARADIQVADFAVAHLPFGQADGRPGSVDQRVGKFCEQPVVIRFAREGDGVALGFGAIAPAIEHGQNDRFRSLWPWLLANAIMFARARALRPGNFAAAPSSSSMRRS